MPLLVSVAAAAFVAGSLAHYLAVRLRGGPLGPFAAPALGGPHPTGPVGSSRSSPDGAPAGQPGQWLSPDPTSVSIFCAYVLAKTNFHK